MLPPQAALEAASTLGLAGRWTEAEAMCRMALSAAPSAQGEFMLGVILANRSRLPSVTQPEALSLTHDAIAAYGRALAIEPFHLEALNNLGSLLLGIGQRENALRCFLQLAEIAPEPKRLINLSMTAFSLGHQHLALAAAARAETMDPGLAEAASRKGSALAQLGRFDEARDSYERALALDPNHREAMASLIYLLDFDLSASLDDHTRTRRRWLAQRFPDGLPAPAPYANSRDPDRRLRIGYLSADFRHHSATLAFAPVVMSHNRGQFSVHLYSSTLTEDEMTASYRAAADGFRAVRLLDDDQLAALIREDGIDILIDLSGHLASERMRCLALKPAPVQMTGWGAVTGTGTGLPAIDYILADAITAPEAERGAFVECVADLPCVLPYTVTAPYPDLAPPPATVNGFMTFGSLNRIVKLWPSIPLYARVLQAVPHSRLLLKCSELDKPEMQDEIRQRFAALGIGADRLMFMGQTSMRDHLLAYNGVDLVLDPIPHTGGVTALDGLFMGVPAVTRRSVGISGKLTSSFQSLLGLDEFSAPDDQHYVSIASDWAGRISNLADLRPTIRERLLASVIVNRFDYTAAVERIYRGAWRKWCAV